MENISKTVKYEPTQKSEPYAMRWAPLARGIVTFLQGRSKVMHANYTLGTSEQPWPSVSDTTFEYTREEIVEAGVRMVAGAATAGGKACEKLPTGGTQKSIIAAFKQTHTVTRGMYANQKRNLVMNGLAKMRGSHVSAGKKADKEAAISVLVQTTGHAFYALGVNDKDGNPIPHASPEAAIKAWCRSKPVLNAAEARIGGGYGADWWKNGMATVRKLEGATKIAHGLEALANLTGEVTGPSVLKSMHALKVVKLAEKAGAPVDVYTGTGAKNRCINWFIDNQDKLTQVL